MASGQPRRRSIYVCQRCEAQAPRWLGRCPECGEWNTLLETAEPRPAAAGQLIANGLDPTPVALDGVVSQDRHRIKTSIAELDRVLGGGIVHGSVILLGGDPGIGKSTLALQVAAGLEIQDRPILYVSGEESTSQIVMRAQRIASNAANILALSETSLDRLLPKVKQIRPALLIVDSIQAVYLESLSSTAGSASQVRGCAMALLRLAKESFIPTLIIGHVTKEGAIAGPRALEHIVDVVLYLEGERFHSYRLLRGVKNRFGSTNEVGVFEMLGDGLKEVENPSHVFLAERPVGAVGSTVAVTVEGTRPMLVEVQALATYSPLAIPRRTVNGADINRIQLITAVLTKRVGLGLANQDIYVNIVGGLHVEEPAADLAIATAIASSFRDRPVAGDLVAIGEIGLAGELRRVSHLERRLTEASKLGFTRCILPSGAVGGSPAPAGLSLLRCGTLVEALEAAWRIV